MTRRPNGTGPSDVFSPVQTAIARELINGLTNAEIADKVGCAVKTVEVYLTIMVHKRQARSIRHLAALLAMEHVAELSR